MKRILFFLSFSIFVLSSCQETKIENSVQVTILHINDVYEIAPINKGKEGGYARFAYLLDSIKIQNPNTISVHAGDFLSPSLIGNLKDENGKKIKGRHMIEVMNASGLDYVTFGNHEFDIKENELLERLSESKTKWISSNVYHRLDSTQVVPFESNGVVIPKTEVVEFINNDDTFKLGIIAVTLPFNQKSFVYYRDYELVIEQILDTISADKVVLLSHLEREDDKLMAKRFPMIPLIMGGHDHYHFIDTMGSSYVAKADANLRTAWKHNLTYNFTSEKLTVESELLNVNASIPEKESVKKIVDRWLSFADQKAQNDGYAMNKILWEGDSIWEIRETIVRANQTNFGALVANAMIDVSGADIALLNSGSLRYDDQILSVITEGDILKALPFGGSISTSKISGNDLIVFLESGLDINKGTGGYLQIPNVKMEKGIYWLSGSEIEKAKMYSVVTSSFMASGRENNLEDLKDYDWETQKKI
ncbi:MAG: bifunctional metallophosphatase/5'-nucleotidase, partial [Salibacteraceae bacterium]